MHAMSIDGQILPDEKPAGDFGKPSMSQTTPVRVLAVDDNAAACKLLALILSPHGFSCTTACNGELALANLEREPFDAVISDLHMPRMDGLELLAQVRRRYPHLAFLVTTGVDDVEVGVQAMRHGADDYLVKPLHDGAVLASLERALHKHKIEQELEHYREHLEETVAERTAQVQSALKQIERNYEDTLRALGTAIDLRDNETAGHSQRVCLFSLEIGRAMGWQNEQLLNLTRGAYLHDIGKLGVPDRILLKAGPLDAEEWKLMQRHAQIGFDLIKNIPFLGDAAEIVLTHHERFDGRGYPSGLKGEEIPVSSRIFSIADTLDAMTSDRPYRRASSFEDAHETIRRLAGTQFDLAAVEVFLKIPKENWETIGRNQRQTLGLSLPSDVSGGVFPVGLARSDVVS
jgi:response regulator RpfG family c-di-GMP phosphodiesterase